MEKIKDILDGLIKNLELKRDNTKENLDDLLKKVLNKQERKHVCRNRIEAGILSLWVDSPSWLYQLGLKKDKILAKIQDKNNQIKDIRFYLGMTNG